MLQLKLGTKGELLIPKKIREQIGLTRDRRVILDVKEKVIHLRASEDEDIAKKWEERAKKHKANVAKWIYGDKLYEKVF